MATPNAAVTDRLLAQAIRRLESFAPEGKQLLRAMDRIGGLMEARIKQRIVEINLIDNSYLINSIRYEVHATPDGAEVVVGSYGVKYARIHEFGTVGAGGSLPDIVPVRARKLTIPASPWAKDHRARDFKLIRIKNMLVDPTRLRNSPDGKIPRDAIGFWLADRARIKPKHYMRDGVAAVTPRIIDILRELGGSQNA